MRVLHLICTLFDVKEIESVSHSMVSDSCDLWTVACSAPLSMRFPRQEYWSGLPFPSPGDLPDPGIEPTSLVSPALAGVFFTTSTMREALILLCMRVKSLQSCPTL